MLVASVKTTVIITYSQAASQAQRVENNDKEEPMQKVRLTIAALAGLSCPATADYIPAGDSIMFLGNAYFNYSNQTIDFRREQPFAPYESPGSPFTQLGPNLGFVWQNEFTNLPISQIGTGSNQWCGANCLVTIGQYDGPLGAWLNVLDRHLAVNQPDSLVVGGRGIFSMTGYDPDPGQLDVVRLRKFAGTHRVVGGDGLYLQWRTDL